MPEIYAKPHPIQEDVYYTEVPINTNIKDIIGGVYDHVHVAINDRTIPHAYWDKVYTQENDKVIIAVRPDATAAVSIIASYASSIATTAALGSYATIGAAIQAGAYATAAFAALAGAVTGVVVSMALNSLIQPQTPEKSGGPGQANRWNRITGAQNKPNRYGSVPKLYGTFRYYPTLAANYYTEARGEDQFLRVLLCLGYGSLDIDGNKVGNGHPVLTDSTALTSSNIQIGETDIFEYSDFNYEIGTIDQITLYSNDITQQNPRVALDFTGTGGSDHGPKTENVSQTLTTEPDTDEISIDLNFPEGLWTMGKDGDLNSGGWDNRNDAVRFKIEYAPTGTTNWTTAIDPWQINGHKRDPFARNQTFNVARGHYDVRVTRIGTSWADKENVYLDATWSALRSIKHTYPWINYDTVLMAIKIKSTGQLNGILNSINVKATSVLEVWDGSSYTATTTNNPAWAYLDTLRGIQTQNPVPDDKIDLAAIKNWADWCDINNIEYNWLHDSNETIVERLRAIASTGRASWALVDGVFSVIRDKPNQTPKQLISPRNAKNFKSTKVFHDIPHALKVKFIDPDSWEETERIVYADGYNESNATKFEVFETQGVTDPDQAWKEGRFHLAQIILRPEVYELDMDIENVVVTRGDSAYLAYDSALIGIKWARIKEIDGSDITIDEEVTIESGTTYGVKIRLNDNTYAARTVTNSAETTTTLSLDSAVIGLNVGLNVGDLLLFGVKNAEAIEVKIISIDYNPDLSATLRLVDAADAIHDADTGTIPPYDPVITKPPGFSKPTSLFIIEAVSNGSTLITTEEGKFRPGIDVSFVTSVDSNIIDFIEIEYSYDDVTKYTTVRSDTYASLTGFPAETDVSIRIRSYTLSGIPSDWSATTTVTSFGLTAPDAPIDLTFTEDVYDMYGTAQLNWTESPYIFVDHYKVEYKPTTATNWKFAGTTTDTQFNIKNLVPNNYSFRVKTISTHNIESLAATVNGAISTPSLLPRVSGLELFNGANSTEFNGKDAKFVWRKASKHYSYELGSEDYGADGGSLDFYFKDYEVKILDVSDNVLRIEYANEIEYVYTYEKNVEDGGPNREFTIEVRQRGRQGQLSTVPARLTVSNPPPADVSGLALDTSFRSLFVNYTTPSDTDWMGTNVWVSNTGGFTPSDVNLAYSGPDTSVTIKNLEPGTTYYVRVAAYDVFGRSGLNISNELVNTTALMDVDDVKDGAIDAPKLAVDAVGSAQLADLSVTLEKLANASVDTAKLSDLSVDASKLADSSVEATKIANAAVGSAAIANAAIGTAHIDDAAITNAKIKNWILGKSGISFPASPEDGEIFYRTDENISYRWDNSNSQWIAIDYVADSGRLVDGVITSAKIGYAAISSAKIVDAAITNAKIANLAVDTAKIADLAVETVKIQDQAVTIPVSAVTQGDASQTDQNWYTAQSISITSTGAPIFIFCSLITDEGGFGDPSPEINLRITRNGTEIASNLAALDASTGDRGQSHVLNVADTPGAGTFTYDFDIQETGGDAEGYRYYNRSMLALEVKK